MLLKAGDGDNLTFCGAFFRCALRRVFAQPRRIPLRVFEVNQLYYDVGGVISFHLGLVAAILM